jgi:16S rRNA (guanine(966)-N(2))-methyltransferase RsmD
MRIIGGKYKRRVIHPPRNLPVRPTTDLAKESLFNILTNRIDLTDKVALDLFAGTGAISYEFISRGCKEVIAVERNFHCIRFIKETSEQLDMVTLKTIKAEVFGFLNRVSTRFDVIFADPPYDLERIDQISPAVFQNGLLNSDGWLVIEHPKETDLSQQPNFFDHRRYGHVNFSFFKSAP